MRMSEQSQTAADDTQGDATPSLTTTSSCCIETECLINKDNRMKALKDLVGIEKRLSASRQHQ